ncbi:hypothetical protein BKA70DRAFT_1421656 [Coprinopsis sp. MPI-PUGE-AT-0042]|nr:hypothetical protein BKA70DRAFT_1421656 [Coprinopsis sp. MPI-PUGE-AT-0042]
MEATVVNDLPCSASESQRDAAQVVATGSRSWKTLKGMSEAIWPLALDSVLIEALEEYRKMEAPPTTSENGERHTTRDRYISDYILEKKGKTCTATQVSSRLQQLRDSCKDGHLSSLLGKPETPPTPWLGGQETVAIHVQLECPSEQRGVPALTPQVHLKPNDVDTPYYLYLMPASHCPLPPVSSTPSLTLSSFSSVVELVSPFPLSEETTWTVYKDKTFMHQERTVIRMTSPAAGRLGYVCDLVPSLWRTLCDSEDPNSITIVQKVRSALRSASIVYHFNLPNYPKFKLRPVDTGIPSNATSSSLTSFQVHNLSSSSLPAHGSSLQGGKYWSSNRQDSFDYRGSGNSEHHQVHEVLPVDSVSNPDSGERNLPLTMDGPSIFLRCAKVVLQHCKIISGAVSAHPAVSSDVPRSGIPSSPSAVVQEATDLSPPATTHPSASASLQEHAPSGPPPTGHLLSCCPPTVLSLRPPSLCLSRLAVGSVSHNPHNNGMPRSLGTVQHFPVL